MPQVVQRLAEHPDLLLLLQARADLVGRLLLGPRPLAVVLLQELGELDQRLLELEVLLFEGVLALAQALLPAVELRLLHLQLLLHLEHMPALLEQARRGRHVLHDERVRQAPGEWWGRGRAAWEGGRCERLANDEGARHRRQRAEGEGPEEGAERLEQP